MFPLIREILEEAKTVTCPQYYRKRMLPHLPLGKRRHQTWKADIESLVLEEVSTAARSHGY